MKTTLIGIGEQAGEVLRSCAELRETEVVAAQSSAELAAGADSELVITVADAEHFSEGAPHCGGLAVELVMLPYGQRERLEQLHEKAAGRNVVFIPQQAMNASDAAEYARRCTEEAAATVAALKRLADSFSQGIAAIDEDDLRGLFEYGENTYKAIFSVKAEGARCVEECIEKALSHGLVKASPAKVLCQMFFPASCTMEQIDRFCSALEGAGWGVVFAESGAEIVLAAVYD